MKHIKIADYSKGDYASFWKGKERQYFDEVEKQVIDKLLPKKGEWFIDLGCGFGRFKELYLNRYKNIVMFDFSQPLLNQAMTSINYRKFPNVYFVLADIYNLPFRDNSFDVSLMIRVFHHLQEPDLVIKQLHRILKYQGKVVFNFDNKRNIREIVKYLRRKSEINPFRVEHLNVGKDELLYYSHPLFVKKLLSSFELDIIDKMGVGLFYGNIFSDTYNPVTIEKRLVRVFGKYFLTMFIFLKAIMRARETTKLPKNNTPTMLINLIICPDCKSEKIVQKQQNLLCLNCNRTFPITGRMYDLRIS